MQLSTENVFDQLFVSWMCESYSTERFSEETKTVNLTVRAGFVTSFNAVQGSNGQMHICVAGPGLASD